MQDVLQEDSAHLLPEAENCVIGVALRIAPPAPPLDEALQRSPVQL